MKFTTQDKKEIKTGCRFYILFALFYLVSVISILYFTNNNIKKSIDDTIRNILPAPETKWENNSYGLCCLSDKDQVAMWVDFYKSGGLLSESYAAAVAREWIWENEPEYFYELWRQIDENYEY